MFHYYFILVLENTYIILFFAFKNITEFLFEFLFTPSLKKKMSVKSNNRHKCKQFKNLAKMLVTDEHDIND